MTSIASLNDQQSGNAAAKLLLVLNCAEARVQIVLARGAGLILHQEWAAPARVMRYLAPSLDRAMTMLGLNMNDLHGIACVHGPGNFTGIRVSLATVHGLALGAGLPMAGLDYLPLLAAGPGPLLSGRLAVLTHARQNLVHAQLFRVPQTTSLSPVRPMHMDDPGLLSPNPQDPEDLNTPLYVLGSGVRRNLARLERLAPYARILDPTWDNPLPDVLIKAARNAVFSCRPIAPMYLRQSDAEADLDVFAAKRGLSPQEARQRLRAGFEDNA